MDFKRMIKRFFRRLFCNHTVKDVIGFSYRRNKSVYQCCRCGKKSYSRYLR